MYVLHRSKTWQAADGSAPQPSPEVPSPMQPHNARFHCYCSPINDNGCCRGPLFSFQIGIVQRFHLHASVYSAVMLCRQYPPTPTHTTRTPTHTNPHRAPRGKPPTPTNAPHAFHSALANTRQHPPTHPTQDRFCTKSTCVNSVRGGINLWFWERLYAVVVSMGRCMYDEQPATGRHPKSPGVIPCGKGTAGCRLVDCKSIDAREDNAAHEQWSCSSDQVNC